MSGKQEENLDPHYDDAPGAKKGASRAMTTWQDFEGEMAQRESEIASILPSSLSPEKFKNWAIAAVKQNPELLECTPRSLFQAITRSAQDGILPDGREGVISVYNTKVKRRGQEVWEKQAQWNPMAFGLRKRARELDGILIDAQVVHEGDHFVWHQGDEPRIEHEPARLGTDRGKMIGAYAIFKRENGNIIAREVMDVKQIETVQHQSKQPDGLMWKKFTTEAWRKTVLRRGIKSVPVSEGLQEIIRRDDEATFEFNDRHEATALVPPPAPPVAPAQIEHKQQVPMTPPPAKHPAPAEATSGKKQRASRGKAKEPEKPAAPEPEDVPPVGFAENKPALKGDWDEYLDRQLSELKGADKPDIKQAIRETVADAVQGATERGEVSRADADAIMERWEAISADD